MKTSLRMSDKLQKLLNKWLAKLHKPAKRAVTRFAGFHTGRLVIQRYLKYVGQPPADLKRHTPVVIRAFPLAQLRHVTSRRIPQPKRCDVVAPFVFNLMSEANKRFRADAHGSSSSVAALM